jgi:hypothetical protein
MQPIRHALGGLLLEQNLVDEAVAVFRQDLKLHPRNPWALVGLIQALQAAAPEEEDSGCCATSNTEIAELQQQLADQRSSPSADYKVEVACACCSSRTQQQPPPL